MATFLQLAPEFGGTKFGPFPAGTVNLGTDQRHCQIVLGPMPGIAPLHVSVIDHGNGSYTVSPVDRSTAVILVQGGKSRSLDRAVSARPGDSIVLGMNGGPRFTIVSEMNRPVGAAAAAPRGGNAAWNRIQRQGGMGNAIANEVQRQATARIIRQGPFREVYTWYYRFKSGAFLNPRYIVGLAVMLIFAAGSAIVSCLGLGGAWMVHH